MWLAGLLGCQPTSPSSGHPTSVEIVAPLDGTFISGTSTEVEVEIHGAILIGPRNTLDHSRYATPLVQLLLELDGVEFSDDAYEQRTLIDLSAGAHTLDATLLWADGVPLQPEVTTRAAFAVQLR